MGALSFFDFWDRAAKAIAVVGGAASGQQGAAKAGQGIMMGSQGLAQRGFLAYQRDMESSADNAALKFLKATGQSAKGMLTLFQLLASLFWQEGILLTTIIWLS